MKKLYQKSELAFAIVFIVAYCVIMSIGDSISETVGITDAVTLPFAAVLSAVLTVFLKKNGLFEKYGLCKPKVKASAMLYYVPAAVLLTANLLYGTAMNLSLTETVLYILTMFFVGFLEEIIFRGLLFGAMLKDNVKAAIIVSSVTFGIGHIIRLFNGSGAELFENILQVIYAIAAGFMFVMIYYKSKSLICCIVTHGLFNALSVFSNEAAISVGKRIFSCIFLVSVSGFYALYLFLSMKKQKSEDSSDGIVYESAEK